MFSVVVIVAFGTSEHKNRIYINEFHFGRLSIDATSFAAATHAIVWRTSTLTEFFNSWCFVIRGIS